MAYKTLYQIFDKNKQLLFSNTNSSCFAEWTGSPLKASKALSWTPGHYMEVYFSISETENKDDSLIEFWSQVLNGLGLKMSFEKREFDEKSKLPNKTVRDLNWVCTLYYDDYTSKIQFKYALHMMRNIYESGAYQLIEKTREIYKENPEVSPFEIFQYVCVQPFNFALGSVHYIYYKGRPVILQPIEELKEYYKKWETMPYGYNDVQNMVTQNYDLFQLGFVTEYKKLSMTLTPLKEYIEITKNLKKDGN